MSKPSLRFKDYQTEWQEKPLKNLVNKITTGSLDANAATNKGKYKFFTCSRVDYKTDTYEFDGDAIIVNGNGELGVTKTYSGKFNAYQRTYVLMDFLKEYQFLGKAIPHYLPNKIKSEAIGGAMPYIKMNTLADLMVKYPNKEEEQKQIAEFLSNVASLLEEKKKELEKTKKFKQTMLSKMFPHGNSKVPEIRFNGFNDNWNEEIYGNIFEKINNNSYSRDLLNYKSGTSKSIHYGDILIKFGFTVDVNHKQVPFINQEVKISTSDRVNILKSGDVVFADTAEDTTAGKAIEIINNNNTPTFAGLHTFASRPLKYFENGFLGICFNTSQFHDQLIPFMQGTKVTGFNYDSLCKTLVRYPNNKEQKKIVEFFETLNKNINNLENEIVNLEHLKSTLLNKMFA